MIFLDFDYIYFHKAQPLSFKLVIFNPDIFFNRKMLGFFFFCSKFVEL